MFESLFNGKSGGATPQPTIEPAGQNTGGTFGNLFSGQNSTNQVAFSHYNNPTPVTPKPVFNTKQPTKNNNNIFTDIENIAGQGVNAVKSGINTVGKDLNNFWNMPLGLPGSVAPSLSNQYSSAMHDLGQTLNKKPSGIVQRFAQDVTGVTLSALQGATNNIFKSPVKQINPEQHIIDPIAQVGGQFVSLDKIGAGIGKIIGATPIAAIGNTFPKLSFIPKLLQNIGAFDIYGQLDPQVKDRMKQLSSDTLNGALLTTIGEIGKMRYSVPLAFGSGVAMAKLNGANNKDSVLSGILFAALDMSNKVPGLFDPTFKNGSRVFTPQQARDYVINNDMQETSVGKDLLKSSFAAEAQGKNIELNMNYFGISKTAETLNNPFKQGFEVPTENGETTKVTKGVSHQINLVDANPNTAQLPQENSTTKPSEVDQTIPASGSENRMETPSETPTLPVQTENSEARNENNGQSSESRVERTSSSVINKNTPVPESIVKRPEGSTLTPISELEPTKTETEKSLNNARKFIDLSSKGEMESRKPIEIKTMPDGTKKIIDGNATYQILKERGYTHVPTVETQASNLPLRTTSTGGSLTPREETAVTTPLRDDTVTTSPSNKYRFGVTKVDDVLRNEGFISKYNSTISERPSLEAILKKVAGDREIKIGEKEKKTTAEKIISKLERRPNYNENDVTDMLRSTIIAKDSADKQAMLEGLKKHANVVDEDIHTKENNVWGYEGTHAIIETKNGNKIEVQIHTPEELFVDRKLHPFYEEWRRKEEVPEWVFDKSQQLAEQYRQEFQSQHTQLSPETQESIDTVRDALYSGDEKAATELHSVFASEHKNFPSLESLKQEVNTLHEQAASELEQIKQDLINQGLSNNPEDPTNQLYKMAQQLSDHFSRPYATLKITGNDRVYTSSDGHTLKVGGNAAQAFDRLIHTTDIEGFKKNIQILHEKFDKVFTEMYDSIKKGDIDNADYQSFRTYLEDLQSKRFRLPNGKTRQASTSKNGIQSVQATAGRNAIQNGTQSQTTEASQNSNTAHIAHNNSQEIQHVQSTSSQSGQQQTGHNGGNNNRSSTNQPSTTGTSRNESINSPRDLAKHLIRSYVLRGDSLDSLKSSSLGSMNDKGYAHIGGYQNGKNIGAGKIGVDTFNNREVNQVFNLKELYDEIKNENIGEPQNERQSTSVTLNAGINPGLDKFLEEDLNPGLQELKRAGADIKNVFSPASANKQAQKVAEIVSRAKADVANYHALLIAKNNKNIKFFNRYSDAQNVANISNYERTGQFGASPSTSYSEIYKQTMDQNWKELSKFFGKDEQSAIENYVRRNFVFNNESDAVKGASILYNSRRSMSGNKSVFMQRVLDMPLDEALKNMQDRGIKVRLRTSNPEELRLWTLMNTRRLIAYGQVWQELKTGGQISFVRTGAQPPIEMIPLEDRVAKIYAPAEINFRNNSQGYSSKIQTGQYYATPEVARVLNNAISTGLEKYSIYRAARVLENSMNQFQLGLSVFHGVFTSLNASFHDLSLGLRAGLQGKPIESGIRISRSVIPFASVARYYVQGNKILKGLVKEDPEIEKVLNQYINPSGARVMQDQRYQLEISQNLQKALVNGNILGAGVRVPGAVLQLLSHVIQGNIVPNVKTGALVDMLYNVESRLPKDATPQQRLHAFQAAGKSIDNRFGQLVYDNLFWNSAVKDVAFLVTRSVGWNLGDVRELGQGAAIDLIRSTLLGKDRVNSKSFTERVTDRTLFTFSLLFGSAILGGITMYLLTGRRPSELKDYFFPQSGGVDANGNPNRISLPTYFKDIYAGMKNPISMIEHKSSPLLDVIFSMKNNTDYYGNYIWNPNDPYGTQLEQAGKYLLTNMFTPFSITQLLNSNNPRQKALGFFGFNKAPSEVVNSAAQTAAQKAYEQIHGGYAPQTPEQQAVSKLKQQARQEIKDNNGNWSNSPAFKQLMKNGTLKTQLQRRNFIKSAFQTSTQRLTSHLPRSVRANLPK